MASSVCTVEATPPSLISLKPAAFIRPLKARLFSRCDYKKALFFSSCCFDKSSKSPRLPPSLPDVTLIGQLWLPSGSPKGSPPLRFVSYISYPPPAPFSPNLDFYTNFVWRPVQSALFLFSVLGPCFPSFFLGHVDIFALLVHCPAQLTVQVPISCVSLVGYCPCPFPPPETGVPFSVPILSVVKNLTKNRAVCSLSVFFP